MHFFYEFLMIFSRISRQIPEKSEVCRFSIKFAKTNSKIAEILKFVKIIQYYSILFNFTSIQSCPYPRSFSAGRLWQAFSRVVWRPDVSRAGPQFKQKKISRFFRIPANMVILGPFLASMLSKSLKFCTILI